MKRDLNAVVWQEDKWFIAQCLEFDIASQGETEEEALENLRDALMLHFTPPTATVLPNVKKEVASGTLRSILRQAGLSEREFSRL